MAADPKPARRVVDTSAGTAKVRAEGRCRCCGVPGLPYSEGGILNRAHIVAKSQRGDDVEENIIPLCGSGTTGCHGAFDGGIPKATGPSILVGWTTAEIRERVVARLHPDEVRYVYAKKGRWWLSRLAGDPT